MWTGLYRNWWKAGSSIGLALGVWAATAALQVPAGTELHIRLMSKLGSNHSKAKDAVEAQVIAPVLVDGQFLIPAGAVIHGSVESVKAATKPDERASIGVVFDQIELNGKKVKLAAKLTGVDNARESVDADSKIQGILASESISSRMDAGIGKLADKFGGLADILGAAKGAVLKTTEADIDYAPGVEMDLTLTAPLTLDKVPAPGPEGKLASVTDQELIDLVVAQAFQTTAEKPPKPSDVTNIMVVGTQEQLEAVFKAGGWSSAAALSAQSKLETFRAIAEDRGYKEAPVSILLLDGKPPDLVFQKQNNTFAKRHHLRVWRRPATYHDLPVWVIAATHDTGIEFSPENRTFIHKIDSQIDRERAKVVNDLVFTGQVKGLALVDRPAVPKQSHNATGDALETDGKMAVLLLQ